MLGTSSIIQSAKILLFLSMVEDVKAGGSNSDYKNKTVKKLPYFRNLNGVTSYLTFHTR